MHRSLSQCSSGRNHSHSLALKPSTEQREALKWWLVLGKGSLWRNRFLGASPSWSRDSVHRWTHRQQHLATCWQELRGGSEEWRNTHSDTEVPLGSCWVLQHFHDGLTNLLNIPNMQLASSVFVKWTARSMTKVQRRENTIKTMANPILFSVVRA